MPVSLGRGGLRWGLGLHPAMAGPAKAEGDGCAPAGVFAITALFGEAAADSEFAAAARLPYHAATPALKAIDDPASRHYNRIVDTTGIAADWASCEDMRRADERYAVGAVIDHNPEAVPGAGSCIFLHVWAREGAPTAGCTAGARGDIEAICRWLDGGKRPLLVQLALADYERLRGAWGLPEVAGAA